MGDQNNGSGARAGFENRLWEPAAKLHGHMDAAEYKHVVPGLIFLKHISDRFERKPRPGGILRAKPVASVALAGTFCPSQWAADLDPDLYWCYFSSTFDKKRKAGSRFG